LKKLDHLVSPFLSESGKSVLETFLKSVEPYVDTAGLFGNPEEIGESGLEAFTGINERHLMKGRRLYQFALAMADCAGRGEEFLPSDLALQLGKAFSKTARSLHESDEMVYRGVCGMHDRGEPLCWRSAKPKPSLGKRGAAAQLDWTEAPQRLFLDVDSRPGPQSPPDPGPSAGTAKRYDYVPKTIVVTNSG
jgi:hypothetical protein